MKGILQLFLFSVLISFASCKKENSFFPNFGKESIPNFGNVNLNHVFSKEDNELKDEVQIKNNLENYYKNVWENGNLSGGILIAKGDHILLEKYRGFAGENDTRPINEETPLHVASVSKTLTAMAVMKLIDAGKLKLTDPVTHFFPQFPYPQIQVQYLLNHRSGLPKYEYFIEHIEPQPQELSKPFLTNQDILNLLIKYKPELARDTNTGFMYCNTNFALLALIVEKVTGISFPQAMKEIVFSPLKMDHTYIFQEKDTLTAARSFYNNGKKPFPYDRLDLIYGDKNVYTTPRDLFNFSKALFSKDFLKPDLMQMVFTPYSNEKKGINNYGFGFRMKIFDNGEKLTYHNGWWHGSNAVFGHLLKSKVTIIAIGNKFSRRVYSALALSAYFEDFPYEMQKLQKELNPQDSTSQDVDSANTSSGE